MPNLNFFPIFLMVCAIAYGGPKPLPPKSSPSKSTAHDRAELDTTALHKQYVEGDFEEATAKLEAALKNGTPLSHQDSIFIFKHLGVMLTARYETRERGKIYMMRLLEVEPTAKIMDMYASDMIYMIFKNLQDEYEMAQARLRKAQKNLVDDPPKTVHTDPQPPPPNPAKTRSYAWVPWTLGAVAVAGGVTLAVVLMQDGSARKKDNVIQ